MIQVFWVGLVVVEGEMWVVQVWVVLVQEGRAAVGAAVVVDATTQDVEAVGGAAEVSGEDHGEAYGGGEAVPHLPWAGDCPAHLVADLEAELMGEERQLCCSQHPPHCCWPAPSPRGSYPVVAEILAASHEWLASEVVHRSCRHQNAGRERAGVMLGLFGVSPAPVFLPDDLGVEGDHSGAYEAADLDFWFLPIVIKPDGL